MERPTAQMTVAMMLGLVAGIAINFWLFRLGVLWGILGLNISKHLLVAYLCQTLGVNRSSLDSTTSSAEMAPEGSSS